MARNPVGSAGLYATVAVEIARYNRWQNEELYGRCARLGEEQLHRDQGLFFRSLHGTLNHVLYVDRVLLDYAIGLRPPPEPGDHGAAPARHRLRADGPAEEPALGVLGLLGWAAVREGRGART